MTSMCPKLLCLQLFFLEEDLSVHSVRAGGCGVRAGGGWGLWPRSDQLQLCICQTILLRYSRLEEGGRERESEIKLKEFCPKISINKKQTQ